MLFQGLILSLLQREKLHSFAQLLIELEIN